MLYPAINLSFPVSDLSDNFYRLIPRRIKAYPHFCTLWQNNTRQVPRPGLLYTYCTLTVQYWYSKYTVSIQWVYRQYALVWGKNKDSMQWNN